MPRNAKMIKLVKLHLLKFTSFNYCFAFSHLLNVSYTKRGRTNYTYKNASISSSFSFNFNIRRCNKNDDRTELFRTGASRECIFDIFHSLTVYIASIVQLSANPDRFVIELIVVTTQRPKSRSWMMDPRAMESADPFRSLELALLRVRNSNFLQCTLCADREKERKRRSIIIRPSHFYVRILLL